MQDFKKVFRAFAFIAILFSLVSGLILLPYLNSEYYSTQEHNVLDDLAGELDFLTVGSSNTMCSVVPTILDQELGCNSYRLSGTWLTLRVRYFLLERELKRNPVKTVVLDIPEETMYRNDRTESGQGHEDGFALLSTNADRLRYLRQCPVYEDYLNIYAREMFLSIEYWLARLTGQPLDHVDHVYKGFPLEEEVLLEDVSLSPEQARKRYNERSLNMDYRQENIDLLNKTIALCREYDVRVIVMVIPVSDARLWSIDNFDAFHSWLSDYCAQQQVEFYDFNLLKTRYADFNDQDCYLDEDHMSQNGAVSFTERFCDILKKQEKGDVSGYFYDSYEEMKADSPYMQYLQ